jgi:heterotetrameric sarcosine oxidase gamma subunit
VTALSFLTPEALTETISARTPMERPARAAGARFEQRGGWSVPIAFGEASLERRRLEHAVGFADRSSLCKLELHAESGVLSGIVTAASGVEELAPGLAARAHDAWWCPVTPSRVLVLGEPDAARELREAVARAVAEATGEGPDGPLVSVVDVSCGLAALALVGPEGRELLARFCAIDVRPAATPVGGFRPGSVARTPGYVLREAEQQLLVLVGWALGEYLYEVVADAAEHLGGGPVGADALQERQLA